jgi:TolB-like protein
MSIFKELKRRNVIRVAIAYIFAAWLLLQVADVVINNIGAPGWVFQAILLLVALGFPFALIFAWAFELTPEGIKREHEVDRSESITHVTGRKFDFAIIGLLAIAVVFLVVDNYVLVGEPASVASEQTVSAVQPAEKSIAVLPFVNMSSDPEQEYFSDGLSEEILNLLAKVPDLIVIGRTSSFAFKGKNEDLRGIGQALNVKTVLEGSVRKSGDRVRITAQLIDVSNGAHLWSESYDRTLTDIFAVQDSVASEILAALQIHVGVAPTRGRPTESTEAYAQFLKAKAAMNRWEATNAEEFLLQAVELDPEFAEAWELLAYAYWERWGNTLDSATARPLTFNAATKALAIDPDLGLAQVFLRTAADEDSWLPGEIAELERIRLKEPNNVVANDLLAWDLLFAGYIQESLNLAMRAVERDPLSPNAQMNLFNALDASGRRSEALAALELASELGARYAKQDLAVFHRQELRYELSVTSEEANLRDRGLPDSWVRDLHSGASDPLTGQEHLDRRIPEIVASVPDDRAYEMQRVLDIWYLNYGFLDRYFELITEQSDTEILVANGMFRRSTGFTAHPKFLEVAEALDLFELWDERGPPDFCEKVGGEWVCE